MNKVDMDRFPENHASCNVGWVCTLLLLVLCMICKLQGVS